MFKENKEKCGYRKIHALLRKDNIVESEKILRQIMKDNNLAVKVRKLRKFSLYQGEIDEVLENIIGRDFHLEKPNDKVILNNTIFSILEGKVYFHQ